MSNDEHKYYATYKCPLCGKQIRLKTYLLSTQEQMVSALDLLSKVDVEFRKGNTLKIASVTSFQLHIPHRCEDGNLGFAVFAGFTLDKKSP